MAKSTRKTPIRPTSVVKDYDQSAADTELSVSTTPVAGKTVRVIAVIVAYASSVTKDVTVELGAGAGAAWDALLRTIALSNAKYGVWIPDEKLEFDDVDIIKATAPAGGSGVKATLAIYTEV